MKIFAHLNKILNLLSQAERRKLYFLSILVVGMSVVELLGVVSIFPFMSVAVNSDLIKTNKYLNFAYTNFEFSNTQTFLLALGAGSVVSLLIGNAFRAWSSYLLLNYAHMQSHLLSKRVFENYLYQPYQFFLSKNSSDLARNVFSEVGEIVNGLFIPLMRAFGRICSAVFIIIFLLWLNPILALLVGGALSLFYTLTYLFFKTKIAKLGKDRAESSKTRFRVVSEAGGAIKDIKLMNKEEVYLKDFEAPSIDFAISQAQSAVIMDFPRYILEVIAFGGVLLIVMYLIATKGEEQAIAMTSLYAIAGYKLMPSLQEIFSCVAKMRFSAVILESINQSLALEPLPRASSDVTPLSFQREIKLDSISYLYPNTSRNVFTELSFTIKANSSIGIVGPTGCGKTTLVDIILGLLSPTEGGIFIDDVKLTKSNLSAWQKNIGYVPQFIYLSDSSITSNIAFGVAPDLVDLDRIIECGKLAQIHDFIDKELPLAYDTVVGERGIRLSGGQRQRIGIARALYHNPSLIVFDEATSALDSKTEQEVMEGIEKLMGKKTIIMIAHRVSTLASCDEIIDLTKMKNSNLENSR